VNIPNWYSLLLLSLAAWRTFRLLAHDDILDKPRRKLLRLSPDWQDGEDPNPEYRFTWGEFITCPYCAGAWISGAWWLTWQIWPHATLVVAALAAINTILIAANKLD
jgi:hypothetical protein